ncbi:MAG: CaiB/BaiF CoA transferase family protein [Alphaproteobacteria bacterium]
MNEAAQGALAGIRVVDLTRVLGGPYCTQFLGDHGAEIVKVEPPQGDETRAWGPPFRGDQSSYFTGVNRNKRDIGLDLSRPQGREVLLRLIAGADVLVENFMTGTLEKWGIGYEQTLAARFPRLVHCRISGFGADGPLGGLPGYDAAVQACAGVMSVNGTPQSGPVRVGTPIVDLGAGLIAANAILMALVERERSGRGQFVETTLYDSAISLLHPQAANWFMSGKTPEPIGNSHPNISPYDQFPTATCPVFLAVGNDRQFHRLCEELGEPALADDPRFASNAERIANRPALSGALTRLLAAHDGEALCDRLLRLGVPCGPVLDIPAVMTHAHTRHRDMVVEAGAYRGTGIPAKFSRTPGSVRRVPPTFGEHGRELLAEVGYSADEIEALAAAGVLVEQPRRLR